MTIKVGDRLPDVTFRIMTGDGPKPVTTQDVFGGKKMVLFAVPGAFTPTCHKNHLPGYVQHGDLIKAKGVDGIAVTGVNDPFVMKAWEDASGTDGKIIFLSDGNADFAKAIGMDLDGTGFGLGIRSKRYSMVVKDGVVEKMAIEEAPGQAAVSGAEAMLSML
ncbi:MAG: peroxiredoxin [Beijerinckiaceae bacterium]